jgi:hypothetical protein
MSVCLLGNRPNEVAYIFAETKNPDSMQSILNRGFYLFLLVGREGIEPSTY